MAEIKVERKDKNPIWPWILGVLILIGLVWGVAELLDDDEPEMATTEVIESEPLEEEPMANTEVLGADEGAIGEFVMFAEEAPNAPDMGLDHEYTSEGLMKLSAALGALAQTEVAGDQNIAQKLNDFQQKAQQIQQDPESLKHANLIQEAFTSAAALMEAIQEKSYPNSNADVDQVQEAANKIAADQQTLNQKEAVKDFFREAGEALETMVDVQENNM